MHATIKAYSIVLTRGARAHRQIFCIAIEGLHLSQDRLEDIADRVPDRAALWLLLLLAFTLRLVARLPSGAAEFLENSYSFYLNIANTLLSGAGLCLSPREACALRVPVYPVFLAPFLAAGWFYPGIVVAQSAIGAALAWIVWEIGDELFNRQTGLQIGRAHV